MPACNYNCANCSDETIQYQVFPQVVYFDLSDDVAPVNDPENPLMTSVYFKQTLVFLWDVDTQAWIER